MTSAATATGRFDVAVVGAGHNGLVAAAYLARAGLSVVVLERLPRVGGAAVSAQPFAGRPTWVSRYADSVSLLPSQILSDLDLDVRLASRPVSAYVPFVKNGRHRGLLVENPEGEPTGTSFLELTDSSHEYDAWCSLRSEVSAMARALVPTLLRPLPRERDIATQVDDATWRDLVTRPLGELIERRFADDTVRGLVASPALAGAFAAPSSPSLVQNRSFLFHHLGSGTDAGGSLLPVGGMGAVSEALARAAVEAGAELRVGVGISAIRPGTDLNEVDFDTDRGPVTIEAGFVLANVAPWVLDILLGEPDDAETKPEGAQLKVNLLLDRLPRLRSGVDPAVAFAGTMLVSASYAELQASYEEASGGRLPSIIPALVTSPSLTDPSLLGEVPPGTQTLSIYAINLPASLFAPDPGSRKDQAVRTVLAALDEHLVDPIESVLAHDHHGGRCVDAWSPVDVEADVAMPGGHPHHGNLEWPWASNRARLDTPDQQWGVSTGLPRVFLASAGARRGGTVSGVAGHNAAQAVLGAQ